MSSSSPAPVRLTPELQAEYQQTYNDPARQGSDEWLIAAKGLFAAGVIQLDPTGDADLHEQLAVADTNTVGQSL